MNEQMIAILVGPKIGSKIRAVAQYFDIPHNIVVDHIEKKRKNPHYIEP